MRRKRCSMCIAPASSKCIGCPRTSSFLCDQHTTGCLECGDSGPYCQDCTCGVCHTPQDTYYCCGCHRRTPDLHADERTSDLYCLDCLTPCTCGVGGAHYVDVGPDGDDAMCQSELEDPNDPSCLCGTMACGRTKAPILHMVPTCRRCAPILWEKAQTQIDQARPRKKAKKTHE